MDPQEMTNKHLNYKRALPSNKRIPVNISTYLSLFFLLHGGKKKERRRGV